MENIIGKSKRVAVVGNGGSLEGANNGDNIDSFDIVIRINNYVTNEYFAKDVGSKQDVWCNSFCNDVGDRPCSKILCPLPLNIPKWLKHYSSTSISQLNKYVDYTTFIPEQIFSELLSVCKNPSTGLCLVYWLVCIGVKISRDNMFGFDHFSGRVSHHYFDDHELCYHSTDEEQIFNSILNK